MWFGPCVADVDLGLLSRQARQLRLRGGMSFVGAAQVAQHAVMVGDELVGGRVARGKGKLPRRGESGRG